MNSTKRKMIDVQHGAGRAKKGNLSLELHGDGTIATRLRYAIGFNSDEAKAKYVMRLLSRIPMDNIIEALEAEYRRSVDPLA